MNASPACAEFVKAWEKCWLTPYRDLAGKWTVGYGHCLQPTDTPEPVTQDEADALFHVDLDYFAAGVERLIFMPLLQHQFDALCSFAFNLGLGNLAMSTLRKRVNGGYFDDAADQFMVWNRYRDSSGVYQVSRGLTKRRMAERAIFLDGDYEGRP